MLKIFALLIFVAFGHTYALERPAPTPSKTASQPQTNIGHDEKKSESDNRGTKEIPMVVEISKAPVIHVETADKPERARDYASAEWWLVYVSATVAIITIALALYTALLYRATVKLGSDAEKVGKRQAKEMRDSIAEANRAAIATESIAAATLGNAALMESILHKQMRAYVAVDIGPTVYQDESLRFGSSPVLANTGFTPAKNVSFQVMADILPTNLPSGFEFEKWNAMQTHDAALSPRQSFVIQGVVRERIPDAEVPNVMKGETKRLYVWGTVTYDDVFGGSWETNFCHHFNFYVGPDGEWKVSRFYNRTHNNAT
jgi:hypothetical protein